MNAPRSFIRATMAPASFAAAIGMAFAMSAPAQAQYRYPGTASSSGHAATISPRRAGVRERAEYVTAPRRTGYANPSMQQGEACPPGSKCGRPNSGRQQSNGGGPASAGGYGGQARYGYGGRAADSERPAQAGGSASISPVRAGSRGALNYGTRQNSNSNFRNSVTGTTYGPSTNVTGQPTSFTGPNGKKVSVGGPQSFTGPNGKQHTIGSGPDLNNLGGGYGHHRGSGTGLGAVSGGGAPGGANGNKLHFNNGGRSGVSDDAGTGSGTTGSGTVAGETGSGGTAGSAGTNSQSVGAKETLEAAWGAICDGIGCSGGGSDGSGQEKANAGVRGEGKPEIDAGPGEIVNGAGNVVTPGKHNGQDDGGGNPTRDGGANDGGGQNAQGHYVAPSGQDTPIKPKEVGTLKMDYNGKNGVTDPKLSGGNGGGG